MLIFKIADLKKCLKYLFFSILILAAYNGNSQIRDIENIGNKFNQIGGSGRSGSSGADSLRTRNRNEDSITISFRYLDSTGTYKLDSSVSDFSRRFPIPATYIYLGNTGNAAKSLLFSPEFSSGFNTGFNAFGIYSWKPESVRFFNTTRPYTELNYQLASRSEQIIDLLHTQNLKPDWNVAFRYRLINAPGFFKSQQTNHNNYLLNSVYSSKNKRYKNYFILLRNKLQSSENGGVQDTTDFFNHPNGAYKDRFNIPTKLGNLSGFSVNFFTTKIDVGNKYDELTVLLKQQYDLGKKDSIVTDSTVVPLFFPRLRFEHTFRFDKNRYTYLDNFGDSVYYKTYYDTTLRRPTDTLILSEKWKVISNDFSIYQFPDAKNLHQFIKAGLTIQNLTGEFSVSKNNFYNLFGHAEYRNKSRNQQWDIEANGTLYFTGLNSGDFEASISLQRLLGNKLGYLKAGFENTNRTPFTIFDNKSSFYLLKTSRDFKKENNTHLFAAYFLPSFKFKLTGHYYLLTNYTYIKNFYQLEQAGSLFNVLQIAAEKTFKLGKHWNWHADVYFQQVIGNGPINVPVIYTRNRIAYEGNLGFKNLDIAMGAELKYRTAYKADGYSPVLGQFFYQDSITIKNQLPDIAAYVHFRIKPFKAFVRAENLNTARAFNGFGFTRNNLVAPGYALPGLLIRLGVYWSFVN